MEWVRGHDLRSVSVTKNGSTSTKTSYYYNESGQVAEIKKSDGSYIRYHYDSDNLEYEERYNSSGNLTALFKYFYDSDDNVSYVLYKHSQFGSTKAYYDLYHYVYNGLGEITDIVKVQSQYDFNINPVQEHVAHYEYDPYGQIIEVNTYNNDNFGNINPIRYKGYYYDTDLDWYHLTSRYYDPSIGRFISPDDLDLLTESTGDITDKNLYSYCDNNPIMRADNGGEFWHVVIGAALGAAVDIACQVVSGTKVKDIDWVSVGFSAASGAAGAGFAKAAGAVSSAMIDGVNDVVKSYRKNKNFDKAFTAFGVGAVKSFVGSKAVDKFTGKIKISDKPNYSKKHKVTRPKTRTKRKNSVFKRFGRFMNRHSSKSRRHGAYLHGAIGSGFKILWSGYWGNRKK